MKFAEPSFTDAELEVIQGAMDTDIAICRNNIHFRASGEHVTSEEMTNIGTDILTIQKWLRVKSTIAMAGILSSEDVSNIYDLAEWNLDRLLEVLSDNVVIVVEELDSEQFSIDRVEKFLKVSEEVQLTLSVMKIAGEWEKNGK